MTTIGTGPLTLVSGKLAGGGSAGGSGGVGAPYSPGAAGGLGGGGEGGGDSKKSASPLAAERKSQGTRGRRTSPKAIQKTRPKEFKTQTAFATAIQTRKVKYPRGHVESKSHHCLELNLEYRYPSA